MSSRGPVIATVMPKPCLKQAAHAQHSQKHAHFPPPSEEAKRYSGIEYDRTPISIAANELALPPRGCPGHTFDDLDAHRYRHHLKKLRCSKQQYTGNIGHSSNATAANAGVAGYGRLGLATDSGALPSLVHGDTSESEEDEIGRISEGLALYQFPETTLASVITAEPKRLRKAHPRGSNGAGGDRSICRTPRSISETDLPSNFGSNSCLGGF